MLAGIRLFGLRMRGLGARDRTPKAQQLQLSSYLYSPGWFTKFLRKHLIVQTFRIYVCMFVGNSSLCRRTQLTTCGRTNPPPSHGITFYIHMDAGGKDKPGCPKVEHMKKRRRKVTQCSTDLGYVYSQKWNITIPSENFQLGKWRAVWFRQTTYFIVTVCDPLSFSGCMVNSFCVHTEPIMGHQL